jgi:extracellular elastinolytic metalloproteinase
MSRSRALGSVAALALVTLLLPAAAGGVGNVLDAHEEFPDVDARTGSIQPSAEQLAIVEALGAHASWNEFGTPRTLIEYGDFLATGLSGDPATAARNWIRANRALFRLSDQGVDNLELFNDSALVGSEAHAVTFRQRFGTLAAAHDGLITVGIANGNIAIVSSSAVGDGSAPGPASLSPVEAWLKAAANVGLSLSVDQISNVRLDSGWTVFEAAGLAGEQRARLVALPTPAQGVRPAFETIVLDATADPTAYASYVDAQTGEVLIRQNVVHQVAEELLPPPKWEFFTAYPSLNLSSDDTRIVGCWEPGPGCDLVLANAAARVPWDVLPRIGEPTLTTLGNAANSAEAWTSPFTPGATAQRPVSPTRNYAFSWTNQWATSRCSPESFASLQRNDIDAAAVNLFASHNRIHDWSYRLGFTEQNWNAQDSNFGETASDRERDALLGDVQAGAVTGGSPSFLGRDNANMIPNPDGVPSITNMYLWQPLAAGFYPPCVDGDFDMAVIGHEYTHLIENRMIGKGGRRSGFHAGAMGESYSDFTAVEYLNEYGFVPVAGENPFAVGAYVTGNKTRAIRNYGMNASPLNFSDIGYDLTDSQVHADGEIWSAVNFDLRQALLQKYNLLFPASNAALQRDCADGKLPVGQCPGNRRWMQLVFDAYLLMPRGPTMLDARDAYLGADMLRFGGANQVELWRGFARRGFGEHASVTGNGDDQPTPSFESRAETNEATVTFQALAADEGNAPVQAKIFVGHYEARVTPIADTDPATPLSDVARFAPGTYDFVAQAPGYGHVRFSRTFGAGAAVTVAVPMRTNWASSAKGATALGHGVAHGALIDDTESTNWQQLAGVPTVAGTQVTVDLAGTEPVTVRRVQVSALLRLQARVAGESVGQNRFTALRQFEVHACDATSGALALCDLGLGFERIFRSPSNAFPSVAPRPVAPDLTLRSFGVPATKATHVRLVVVSNQCMGGRDFRGEQDADPTNETDCVAGSSREHEVRASELQVFSS